MRKRRSRTPQDSKSNRAITLSDLIPHLMHAIDLWTPSDNVKEAERYDLTLQMQAIQKRVKTEGMPEDIDELLELMIHPDQIDWALEEAFEEHQTRLCDEASALRLHRRWLTLTGSKSYAPITIKLSVRVLDISIPDPSKDELILRLSFFSGASVDELKSHMIATKFVTVQQSDEIVQKWAEADMFIGMDEHIVKYLDYMLSVGIEDDLERVCHGGAYHIGKESGFLWRNSEETIKIAVPFDLSRYPFDRHVIKVPIVRMSGSDQTEAMLIPDDDEPFVVVAGLQVRGFAIDWLSDTFTAVTEYYSEGLMPQNELIFSFRLRRRGSAFLWRVLAPTTSVVAIALSSTALVYADRGFRESVITGLIPGALIACAALHLAAAEIVPPLAGRNRTDAFFVALYVTFLLLILALLTYDWNGLSLVFFTLASLLFVVSAISIAVRIFLNRSGNDRAKTR